MTAGPMAGTASSAAPVTAATPQAAPSAGSDGSLNLSTGQPQPKEPDALTGNLMKPQPSTVGGDFAVPSKATAQATAPDDQDDEPGTDRAFPVKPRLRAKFAPAA